MSGKSILLSGVLFGVVLQAAPALAQEAALDTKDIIVTARKRDESILKVPVNVTVLTADQLDQHGTQDLDDVATLVPNFIIGSQFYGALTSIRGVGTTTTNPGVDQSVALNVDGLQTSQGFSYNSAFFDLGQLEVLRGPQALFFGKNAPAGVIAIRTADPTDQFELIARVGYEFNAQAVQPELIVSGPVADWLKLRLAAQYVNRNSYFKNKPTIAGVGGRLPRFDDLQHDENVLLRGTAVLDPSSIYRARLKMAYERTWTDGNNNASQLRYCPDGIGNPSGAQSIDPADPCRIGRTFYFAWHDPALFINIRNGGQPFDHRQRYYGTLEQNLQVSDGLKITALTGYFNLKRDSLLSALGIRPTSASDHTWKQHEFSQELRLTSDFKDSPVNFMLGGFYQTGVMQHLNRTRNTSASGFISSAINRLETRTQSLFGQVIWKVVPTVELAAGARWTDVKIDHSEITLIPVAAAGGQPALAAGAAVPLPEPRQQSNDFSPEITLTYTPTDDLTFFAGYREGYKSGSFNIATFNAPGSRPGFGPERVKGFEGGIKARFLDRSLIVNLAAYDYNYKDLQVSATEILPGGGFISRTLNAAGASVTGIEFDAAYAPTAVPGLHFNASLGWSKARYDAFTNAPCGNGQTVAEGCNLLLTTAAPSRFTAQDLSGAPLVRAPKWSGAFGANYEFPVSSSVKLGLGANTRYSSKYQTTLVNDRGAIQPSYWITDANIALKGPDDHWELALIVKNLADKVIAPVCFNTNAQNAGAGGGLQSGLPTKGVAGSDEIACFPNAGREIWLRMTVKLGDLF